MLPKISIVTPSFNQAQFLEATLKSVIDQNYPDLEYIVLDGGSTDGSVDIIRKYASHLAHFRSGPDGGQYAAIQEGLQWAHGDVMGWINSDDMYMPWSLSIVGQIFEKFPEVEWLTSLFPVFWDNYGRAVHTAARVAQTKNRFMRMRYATDPAGNGYFIQQESTFWRRSLWDKAGARLDTSLKLAGDFDLWCRFFQHAELYGVMTPLGGFRVHADQKTATSMATYTEESVAVMQRYPHDQGRPERTYSSIQFDHDRQDWSIVKLPVQTPTPTRAAISRLIHSTLPRR